MQYWIMKSEPSEVSIDSLAAYPNQTIEWFGVRNYQARNFMRDEMKLHNLAFFWHSSCKNPGIYGIVEIASSPHPDGLQFDINSNYYDPKATLDKPRWWCVDVKLVKKIPYISIQTLKSAANLQQMQVLKAGNRLSITKVSKQEWELILNLIQKGN